MKVFIILVVVLLILLLALAWLFGGREALGELLVRAFPVSRFQSGDKVFIFLNGKYNRTATVTAVSDGRLWIYGRLPLEVDYRGRFYAVGVSGDGSRLAYLADRRLYRYVRLAEAVRRIFNVMDDVDNLIPTEAPALEEVGGDEGDASREPVSGESADGENVDDDNGDGV